MLNTNLQALKQLSLFRDCDDADLEQLAEKSNVRTFRKNTIIILEKEEAHSIYFILQGKVRVFRENSRGKEITLNDLYQGDFFGELALISNKERCASVITKEDSKLLVMQAKDFEHFYLSYPAISHTIAKKFASQISQLSQHLESVALDDIRQRVIWALQSYAMVDSNNNLVTSATHKELANFIGTSRESVSRAIQELKNSGHIEQRDNQISLNELIS